MTWQYTEEQVQRQAEMLANRVKKTYSRLKKRFRKQNIDVFRLYDWDIPEVRAVVDWYAGHLVIAEYERLQTGPKWLPAMARAVANALSVPMERVFMKRRRTGQADGPRYERLDNRNLTLWVRERDLYFKVNLSDRVDTGLYSDHRDTRVMVRSMAGGQNFLNLYCYTGAFTCAAAAGGAKTTTSVDRSQTYIQWASENMERNGLVFPGHRFVRSDVFDFLDHYRGRPFSLVVVDPPSFSTAKRGSSRFEVLRDHPVLLQKVLRVTAPGGTIFFSTNHQRFEPQMDGLPAAEIAEITRKTIPIDYRNQQIHRCWLIKAPG